MLEKDTHVNNYGRDFIYHLPQTVFLDLTLHLTDIRVYGIIRSFMDTTGEAYPSNEWLATKLGIEKRTVQKSLEKLEDKGYVRRVFDQDGNRHLMTGRPIPESLVSKPKHDLQIAPPHDLQITQLDQSSIHSNNNNSEPKQPKYRNAPALAQGDAVVAKILEKAAAFELPSKPIEKLIKKYGRGKVDTALDLLAKKENIEKINNLVGWITDAIKEDWVDDKAEPAPKAVSPEIEAERYIAESRGTKLHKDALAALEAQGIKPPVGADYKNKPYEIFFNDECKFNIKLVDKMKELKAKK